MLNKQTFEEYLNKTSACLNGSTWFCNNLFMGLVFFSYQESRNSKSEDNECPQYTFQASTSEPMQTIREPPRPTCCINTDLPFSGQAATTFPFPTALHYYCCYEEPFASSYPACSSRENWSIELFQKYFSNISKNFCFVLNISRHRLDMSPRLQNYLKSESKFP